MTPAELLNHWDKQQAAYVAAREIRFAALIDAIELATPTPKTVVDLACGPGSLATRVLDRFESVHVIAVDYDPMLLELGRRTSADYGDRLTFIDADLTAANWVQQVIQQGGHQADAMVSSTALHWLRPGQLVQVYEQSHDILRPGGVLLNADHLRFDQRNPCIARWSAQHDSQTQQRSFDQGAMSWDAWWAELDSQPGMQPLRAERTRRYAGRDAMPPTAVDFHHAALSQAGFIETGTVWQLLDDYVVYGVA